MRTKENNWNEYCQRRSLERGTEKQYVRKYVIGIVGFVSKQCRFDHPQASDRTPTSSTPASRSQPASLIWEEIGTK